jgi:hypothetical protein
LAKNDHIRIDDIGLAFRQSGQNPAEDTIKDLIEKAKALKKEQSRNNEVDEGWSSLMLCIHFESI